ncbi:hypothetical protein [Kocuria rosea]|uniref:hypothetical protein n=1 Tax=Kocuria rosea TaxID=1275 RepID=UPI0025408273|nr:hypothetical protein [Kocuria rosea]WIG18792.1 hypothetical protein QOY29_07715 [Kocuria rosea]
MTEQASLRPVVRWKLILLLFLPGTLFILGVSLWAGLPWQETALLTAAPMGLALLAVLLGYRKTRARDGAYGITTQGATSEASLILELPAERVVRVVDDASHTIRQPRRTKLSLAGAEFDSSSSFKTWGMRIILEFHPVAQNRTLITARAEPKLSLTVIDYGQGAKDLRTLMGAIERRASWDERVS